MKTGRRSAGVSGVRGVAAIEFALIFPLLLTLFFVMVNLSQYVSVNSRLTVAANLVADLVTRNKEITQALIDDYVVAAKLSLLPLDTTQLRVDVYNYYGTSVSQRWHKYSSSGTACSAPSTAKYKTLAETTDVVVVVICLPSFTAPAQVTSPSAIGNYFQIFSAPRQEVAMRPRLGTTLKFCTTTEEGTTCV